MKEKIDLHSHTSYSDGKAIPEQVFNMASDNKVTTLAITDHDMLADVGKFQALAKQYNIRYIPGIEISTTDKENNQSCHIVALNMHQCSQRLEGIMNDTTRQRHDLSLKYIERVQQLGYAIDMTDFENNRGATAIFNLHIMYALVKKGYTDEVHGELYREIYKSPKNKLQAMDYPCHLEVIKEIRASGGIPVLAHPTQFNNLVAVEKMVEAGLMAIEVNYPGVTEAGKQEIKRLVEKYNLAFSGGSDYHGGFLGAEQVGSHYVESWDLC
jgi:predicted metal-dependent phosphoesterase TrpH